MGATLVQSSICRSAGQLGQLRGCRSIWRCPAGTRLHLSFPLKHYGGFQVTSAEHSGSLDNVPASTKSCFDISTENSLCNARNSRVLPASCRILMDSNDQVVEKNSTLGRRFMTQVGETWQLKALSVAVVLTLWINALPALAVDADVACAEEFGGADPNTVIVIACIAEAVALTGAFVGGVLARQRKAEVEKINQQLRQINVSLRKQARVESYAPSLSYAPAGMSTSLAPAASVTAAEGSNESLVQTIEPPQVRHPDVAHEELIRRLKAGKQLLREQNPREAFKSFGEAISLARQLQDPVEEKKAARGLGASLQRQNKFREAIKYHQVVLAKSEATGEHSGDTEAYGAIADCYTEVGDMENAAKYYDLYIGRLEAGEDEAE